MIPCGRAGNRRTWIQGAWFLRRERSTKEHELCWLAGCAPIVFDVRLDRRAPRLAAEIEVRAGEICLELLGARHVEEGAHGVRDPCVTRIVVDLDTQSRAAAA